MYLTIITTIMTMYTIDGRDMNAYKRVYIRNIVDLKGLICACEQIIIYFSGDLKLIKGRRKQKHIYT